MATNPQDLEQSNFPGPPGINFKGNWSSNTYYFRRDVVNYQGSSYYCNIPSAGQTPVINDPTGVWSLLVSKGDKGEKGDNGLKGDKGDPGSKGDRGDNGLKGDKGDQGTQGIQGINGTNGLKGDKGDKGDQGIPGTAAQKGDKGDTGLKGDKGDPGSVANAVVKTGDTMTGDLTISKAYPGLYFTATNSTTNNKVFRIINTESGRLVFQAINDDGSFKSEPISLEQNHLVGIESIALGSYSSGVNRPYIYAANTSEFNIRYGTSSSYKYLTLSNNGNLYINSEQALTINSNGYVYSSGNGFVGGNTNVQYPTNFIATESAHSSGSKRAGVQIGKWLLGQDIGGTGVKNFFIYDTVSGAAPFTINPNNSVVSFQNNVFANGKQLATVDQIPANSTLITLQQPSIKFEGIADRFQIGRNTAQTTNFADMFFTRDLRGNGQVGTKGYVSSSIRIQTTTENNDGYQWGLVSVLDSYGTGDGQHCSGYFQANRRANSSSIWALALETRDFTFDPTKSTIGLEAGIFASGADSNHARIGIDLVVGEASPGVHGYNAISSALRIGAQNEAGLANVEMSNGIEIKDKVFNGINLTGINVGYSNRGIVMSTGQKLLWDNGLEFTTTGNNLTLNMPANGLAPGDGGAYIAFLRVNLGGIGNCCIPVVAYR